MTIAPEAFLPFIDEALEGMLAIAETLGDTYINRRPDLPNTNSPYAILTHCVGMTTYWLGSVLCGRSSTRDRDSEFRARGTVTELRQAVEALQLQIRRDIKCVHGDQPITQPMDLHGQIRYHTQGDVLLHCYTELAQHHGQMELTRDILLVH
jgi:Protein of unknown function (DUF664)